MLQITASLAKKVAFASSPASQEFWAAVTKSNDRKMASFARLTNTEPAVRRAEQSMTSTGLLTTNAPPTLCKEGSCTFERTPLDDTRRSDWIVVKDGRETFASRKFEDIFSPIETKNKKGGVTERNKGASKDLKAALFSITRPNTEINEGKEIVPRPVLVTEMMPFETLKAGSERKDNTGHFDTMNLALEFKVVTRLGREIIDKALLLSHIMS